MVNTDHLGQLFIGLAHERRRLSEATTEHERSLRSVWVAQLEREINGEERFLGVPETDFAAALPSIDDIFAELSDLSR